jgi:dienelactone hydrolase
LIVKSWEAMMKHSVLSVALRFTTLAIWAIAPIVSAQQFSVSPANPILQGEAVTISLAGLTPGQDVKIIAERVITEWGSEKRALYRAEATFAVGADGTLDLATAAPKSGSYKRADARGLFWSMMPVTGEVATDRKLLEVRLLARMLANDKPIAEATITFVNQSASTKTEAVEKFPGALFATQSGINSVKQKRPAVILLGGSEGGSQVTRDAAQLASHGFAVLALPYYSPPAWPSQKAELPTLPAAFADIPVDRLNQARAWLQTRENVNADVDAKRIAVYGTSKGAEFALLAGVYLPWVTSVVAVVPSDVVWEGWGAGVEPMKRSSFSFNGKPLPFVPYADFAKEFMGFQTGDDVRMRRFQDKGRAANPGAAVTARIPVERIKAPVMLVAGQEDQVWNSAMMAHNIAERRAEAKLETVSLIYNDAGHAVGGTGYNPTTQYDASPMKMGGTPEGNARAQADAWPKTIAFLKRTLGVKD